MLVFRIYYAFADLIRRGEKMNVAALATFPRCSFWELCKYLLKYFLVKKNYFFTSVHFLRNPELL